MVDRQRIGRLHGAAVALDHTAGVPKPPFNSASVELQPGAPAAMLSLFCCRAPRAEPHEVWAHRLGLELSSMDYPDSFSPYGRLNAITAGGAAAAPAAASTAAAAWPKASPIRRGTTAYSFFDPVESDDGKYGGTCGFNTVSDPGTSGRMGGRPLGQGTGPWASPAGCANGPHLPCAEPGESNTASAPASAASFESEESEAEPPERKSTTHLEVCASTRRMI